MSYGHKTQERNANLVLGLAKLLFGILKSTRERWSDLRADVAVRKQVSKKRLLPSPDALTLSLASRT